MWQVAAMLGVYFANARSAGTETLDDN